MKDIDTPIIEFGSHFHAWEQEEGKASSDHVDDVDRDAEKLLEWFKKGGVDKVILSDTHHIGVEDEETARRFNNPLLDVVTTYEDYYGLATIPMGAGGDVAAAEFERCLDNRFNGGLTWPSITGRDFTDPVFEPVWEVADQTGAPILVHPTSTNVLKDDYPDEHVLEPVYQVNHAFGREGRLCGSISKVINSGLLNRYPDLTLVYHHYGGNIASQMGRIKLRQIRSSQDDEEYEGATVSWPEFKARLEDRIYIDTSGHHTHPGPLRAALEQFPASNVLLGMDVPSEPKTPTEVNRYITNIFETSPRSAAQQILGQNALDIMVNV